MVEQETVRITLTGPATHRFLAQWVRVVEETEEGCRVIFEDGSGGDRLHPRECLISLGAIEADQVVIKRLCDALQRLSDAASTLLRGVISDRGDLVGALAQAGRALGGEDG